MRVGVDLSFIRPDHKNGGTEAVMKNLIKGLRELEEDGCPLDMVYFIHRDIYEDYNKMFPFLKYRVYDSSLPHALRTIAFQTFRLHKLLREEKVDVLYFPTFQTGLRSKWEIPLVVNPHDIQYKYYPEYFSRFKRIYFQVFYKNALKKANRIVAISSYVKECYEKHFPKQVKNKIRLLYNPIDLSQRDEEVVDAVQPYEGKYVLCINSLTKHKNLITLVKAYHLLIQRNADYRKEYRLVIGGAAWNGANELADYIRLNGLEEDVILTGYLSDGQLTYLYNHARLFVTPSLYEGFGMTPVEAMATGCPVVSSKETSLYEVTMGMVRYYEPATDAEALCKVLADELTKEKALDYLQACKDAVGVYDMKAVSKRYTEVFYETVGVAAGGEDTRIYGELFQMVSDELANNGEDIGYGKKGYEASVGSGSRRMDIAPLLALEDDDFLDALWFMCFQKRPDEPLRKKLQGKSKEQVLQAAADEGAFAIRDLELAGNPYSLKKRVVKRSLLKTAARVKNSVFLRKLAKKMPKGLQGKIRKLFC